jgi:hypothetical protein
VAKVGVPSDERERERERERSKKTQRPNIMRPCPFSLSSDWSALTALFNFLGQVKVGGLLLFYKRKVTVKWRYNTFPPSTFTS